MTIPKSERKIGIVQILLSGFCFGCLGILGKLAYQRGLSGGELLSARFLTGGLMLLAWLAIRRPQKLKLPLRQVVACVVLGVLGYAVFSSCFFQALKGLSASLTVLLLYTYPLIVAAGAWILFGESIARDRWLALPLVMGGLMMLIWGDFQVREPKAIWFGLGAAVFYAIYILASSRWLRRTDSLAAVTYIQLAAGSALGLVNLREPSRAAEIAVENWDLILAIALVGSVLAMSLFLAGLKKLRNWEASVLSTAEPVTGILLAMIFLGEILTALQVAGAIFILGAFLLVAVPASPLTPSRRP